MRRTAQVTSLLLVALTIGLARAQALEAPASPATKNCVGKAKKAKIQAYGALLCLRWDIDVK